MSEKVPEGQRGGMKEQELLKGTKERKQWKAVIAQVLKGCGTKREREFRKILAICKKTYFH